MTRINVVPPEELHRAHLVAEYRELPRIFALVRAAQARGVTPQKLAAPADYTLGKGHVLFFYNKLRFMVNRQKSLIEEMKRRGYHPQFGDPEALLEGIAPCWIHDWQPDEAALALNRVRIAARLPKEKSGSGLHSA
jgi:deoxyribonuclease (pyrimidine dimer)